MSAQIRGYVDRGESGYITGTIKDYAGTAFQPTTLTFTLYDRTSKTIINSRSSVSLTPIGDYVTANGALTFNLTTADNTMVDPTKHRETHVARFVATWSAGAQTMIDEIEFDVLNVATPA
jgi:hypothetical protein